MQQYEMASAAIAQKARSERLYMHYALTLAVLLALAGTALVILGIGAHLDIILAGQDLEARFINASPGVALWLVSATVFVLSKPRRLQASANHSAPQTAGAVDMMYSRSREAEQRELEEEICKVLDPIMDDARAAILGSIAEAKRQIDIEMDAAVTFVKNERHMLEQSRRRGAAPAAQTSPQSESGSSFVLYQEDREPPHESSKNDE